MEVSEEIKIVKVLLTKTEAEKLRNICGDRKVRDTYGFEFVEMLGEKLNGILKK